MDKKGNIYQPTSLFNRFFIFAWIIGTALHIGQNVFNSTITVYANTNEYSNTFAGSLSIGYLIGALIGRLAGGQITDKRTRRAGMLLGTLAFLCASFLFCFGASGNGAVMMILRLIHGFGYGCATTAYYVSVMDVSPKEKASVALGINFTGQSIAFVMVSVLIGVFVTGDSYTMLFIFTSAMVVIAVIFSAAENYEKGVHRGNSETRKQKGRLFEPEALPFAGIILIYYSSLALPLFYVVPLALSKGIAGGSNVFIFTGIGMLAGYLTLPKIADRYGSFAGMLPVYLCGFVGLLILNFTDRSYLFALGGVFYGSVIASIPIMQNAATEHLPANKKGAGTATLNAAIDLTMGLGPLAWGILIDQSGYTVPFLAGAIMFPAALVVHFMADRILKKKRRL